MLSLDVGAFTPEGDLLSLGQAEEFFGQLLTQSGVSVVFAATANWRRYRNWAREAIERFMEVYVRCSLETCIARDQKGVYEKALAGRATTVPGLQSHTSPRGFRVDGGY